jgi:UDP-N-acetylmuramate dehydrogenase
MLRLYQHFKNNISSKTFISTSLSAFSWWKIGGPADCLVCVQNLADLKYVLTHLRENDVPYIILGEGTNILVDDMGFRGCVIKISRSFSKVTCKGGLMNFEAGNWVPQLSVNVARMGFSGLEHTVGIPASLGGLVAMNGGTKRKSISDHIHSVNVLDENIKIRLDLKKDCAFGYRTSRYQKNKDIIVGVNFEFDKMRSYKIQRKEMLAILRERNLKFPRKMPSCGSVFKSSPELFSSYGPPGKIIEDLGFKGLKRGGVQVSNVHANFIINLGNGSSSEILSLVRDIHSSVYSKTGISMDPEFLYVHPEHAIIKVL